MTDPADIIEANDLDSQRADIVAWLASLRPSWHQDAACRGERTASFFPTRGESIDEALQVCGRCPVRDECLTEAIEDPALDHGVRGGMSARARKQRRKLNTKRAAA